MCRRRPYDKGLSLSVSAGSVLPKVRALPLKRAVIGIIVTVCVAGERPALAETPLLRLSDVVAEARRQNPALRAARERARASSHVPAQASAYEDPMFTHEVWNAPESFDIGRADNNISSLSQKIPFPGKKTLAGEISAQEAEVARRDADRVEVEVVVAAKRAFYGLWHVHQELVIYSRDRELVGEVARIAAERYRVGTAAQSDVLRAQVELTRLINRVSTSALAVQTARAELAEILSRGPEEVVGIPESPPEPHLEERAEDFVALGLERRPEIAAQVAEVARAERAVRLARLNYLPDFELRVSRFVNFRQDDGFGAMASISIPLAYRYKYDAALREAEERLAAARAELRRMQDRVRREVTEAFLAARTALLQRDLFVSTHVPQAEQSLAASQIAYQTGKIDFLSLIDSFRVIESVHLEHVRAEADFERSRADLERAVGSELPRGEKD